MNKRSSLNVKISKVAMPQYEYILSKWVSPRCKIISGKYVSGINCHLTKSITDEWTMQQCKYLQIKH